MNMPGFTADVSLYWGVLSGRGYRSVRTGTNMGTNNTASVIAQQRGDSECLREYAGCQASCIVGGIFGGGGDISQCQCTCYNDFCDCCQCCQFMDCVPA